MIVSRNTADFLIDLCTISDAGEWRLVLDWLSEKLYHVTEPIVELKEFLKFHLVGVLAIHAVEWQVAIHGCHHRERARRPYEIIACREHIQVFGSIAVKMMDIDGRTQLLEDFLGD